MESNNNLTVKLAYPNSSKSKFEVDTIGIQFAGEYNIIRSMYSTLFEYNNDGELVKSLVDHFFWKDGALNIKIRDDFKASDGLGIDLEDVYFSLKRNIVMAGNTHGKLESFLCKPNKRITNMADSCEGLYIRDHHLVLKPTSNKKHMLMPLLTTAEFGIVPKRAVNPSTLKINNYKITSGAYYLKQDMKDGNVVLTINRLSHHANKLNPKNIHLVPSSATSQIVPELMKEVDIIPTFHTVDGIEVYNYAATNKNDIRFHRSLDLKVGFINVFKKAHLDLPKDRIVLIGSMLKKSYLEYYAKSEIVNDENMFFGAFSEGFLGEDFKINTYQDEKETGKGIKFICKANETKVFTKIFGKYLPNLEFITSTKHPMLDIEAQKNGHFAYVLGDTSFNEDISLINYLSSMKVLPFTDQESEKWVNEYTSEVDKTIRIEKLKGLHRKMLEHPTVIVLGTTPYIAIAKKPWNFKLSKLYAGTPFWGIVRDED